MKAYPSLRLPARLSTMRTERSGILPLSSDWRKGLTVDHPTGNSEVVNKHRVASSGRWPRHERTLRVWLGHSASGAIGTWHDVQMAPLGTHIRRPLRTPAKRASQTGIHPSPGAAMTDHEYITFLEKRAAISRSHNDDYHADWFTDMADQLRADTHARCAPASFYEQPANA